MAKKTKKTKRTKSAPSVQKTLVDLCEMVNKLSQRVAELQLEIGALRGRLYPPPAAPPVRWPNPPEPLNPNPWGPTWQPPYEVTCESKGLPPGLMYNRQSTDRSAIAKAEC